jgi:hypothetical protein
LKEREKREGREEEREKERKKGGSLVRALLLPEKAQGVCSTEEEGGFDGLIVPGTQRTHSRLKFSRGCRHTEKISVLCH